MLLDDSAGPDDGMVHVAPMSHGPGRRCSPTYIARRAQHHARQVRPGCVLRGRGAAGGTSTFVVPTMIRMLLDAPECTPERLAIRNMTYGGAPMPVALAEEAIEASGRC